jgi:Leucine-rich repeat (LRR) protein
MGPWFPRWLRWQTSLEYLNISDASINDVLPHWFWAVSSNASYLDLSRNGLNGNLPAGLELPFILEVDLSGNNLSGHLPANLTAPNLTALRLFNNHLTGTIPAYVCHIDGLQEINLSENQLTGDFPRCHRNSSLFGTDSTKQLGSSLYMVDLRKKQSVW